MFFRPILQRVCLCGLAGLCMTTAMAQTMSEPSKKIIQWCVEQQADSILAHADVQLKQALSANQIKQLGQQLLNESGKLVEVGKADTHILPQGYEQVCIPLQFERKSWNMICTWTKNHLLAGWFLQPLQKPIASPPSPHKAWTTEELTLSYGNVQLPGTLTLPTKGTPPYTTALLLAGSGPCDRNETLGPNTLLKDLADSLALKGIASFRYDKRTFVYKNPQAPQLEKMDFDKEVVDDAIAALNMLAQHKGINAQQLWIIGHSLGGMLTPKIAMKSPTKVAGLVLLAAPSRTLSTCLREQLNYLMPPAQRTPENIEKRYQSIVKMLPPSYQHDMEQYKPTKGIDGSQLPATLIIQGGHDYQSTLTDAKGWMTTLKGNKKVEWSIFPRLNHLLSDSERMAVPQDYMQKQPLSSEVVDTIVKFIKKN